MGPRDLNSLRLKGRLPKEPNQSHYIIFNVFPVGKTNLDKDRGNINNTSTVSCFVSPRQTFILTSKQT